MPIMSLLFECLVLFFTYSVSIKSHLITLFGHNVLYMYQVYHKIEILQNL